MKKLTCATAEATHNEEVREMAEIKCPDCGKLFSNALTDLVLNPTNRVIGWGVEGTQCPGCGRRISIREMDSLSTDALLARVKSMGSNSGGSSGQPDTGTLGNVASILYLVLAILILVFLCKFLFWLSSYQPR